MIVFKELIRGYNVSDIPLEHQFNLESLLKKMNVIRERYGKPMIISSGYRSMQEHLRIYSQKGITDKSKIPMNSHHLSGKAVDIADNKQELQTWLLANVHVLEELGLWCEDFSFTKNWVHFQTVEPRSGCRFYRP